MAHHPRTFLQRRFEERVAVRKLFFSSLFDAPERLCGGSVLCPHRRDDEDALQIRLAAKLAECREVAPAHTAHTVVGNAVEVYHTCKRLPLAIAVRMDLSVVRLGMPPKANAGVRYTEEFRDLLQDLRLAPVRVIEPWGVHQDDLLPLENERPGDLHFGSA